MSTDIALPIKEIRTFNICNILRELHISVFDTLTGFNKLTVVELIACFKAAVL